MKKISLIFLATALTIFSCEIGYKDLRQSGYKKSHANDDGDYLEYEQESHPKRSRRISPSETMALGLEKSIARREYYKKKPRSNRLSSIKSQHHNKLEENQEIQPFNLHGDFDEIFVNGKYVGYYKIGNPYEIEGVPYYPQEYDDYEEVGVASWYGEQFDGKMTANGEIYNLGSMTAAHQTLPLPSIVKVTNLTNGKSVVVRVNDRGPFAKNRIIDLSKKAAKKLEYQDKGTTTVKVEYLPDETEELLRSLRLK